MAKRYQGNSGRFDWMEPPRSGPSAPPPPPPPAAPPEPAGPMGLHLLPRLLGELETEDMILLLLCWLLYRESGDSDWLIVLAALVLA